MSRNINTSLFNKILFDCRTSKNLLSLPSTRRLSFFSHRDTHTNSVQISANNPFDSVRVSLFFSAHSVEWKNKKLFIPSSGRPRKSEHDRSNYSHHRMSRQDRWVHRSQSKFHWKEKFAEHEKQDVSLRLKLSDAWWICERNGLMLIVTSRKKSFNRHSISVSVWFIFKIKTDRSNISPLSLSRWSMRRNAILCFPLVSLRTISF